ncbi:hypothetical protein IWW42_001682 [Coemansia sp. RSA 1085]|nr:hypothetical protein IWW42_001682 [Coemansia sp. RSA 1085]
MFIRKSHSTLANKIIVRQLTKNCLCTDTCAATSQPCAHIPVTDRTLEAEIRKDYGYPAKYHGGSFPWLLSAERQRTPMEDLDAHAQSNCAMAAAVQLMPLAARRRLAHSLNMRIAQAALGTSAIDGVCEGAAAVLPRVASLLSGASRGDSDATAELSNIFTSPLLARYMRDLGRLRDDHVQLKLEVHGIDSAYIRQLRTQAGPEAAFAALNGAAQVSSLRAGLTRQQYQYTSILGATHAAAGHSSPSWSTAMMAAMSGQVPVRVRVDVELMVNMRYRLLGISSDRPKTIVDDDSTRNLMLTLESSVVSDASSQTSFEWRIADIDYLLSSEQRMQHEFDEAKVD